MALTIPPVCDFGWEAVKFSLPATDGSEASLDKVAGSNGTLLMFICNHCPSCLRLTGSSVMPENSRMPGSEWPPSAPMTPSAIPRIHSSG